MMLFKNFLDIFKPINNTNNLVLLARFYDPVLGHIAKGVLENNDIPCFIFDSEHTTVPWDIGLSMGATRLMVLKNDRDKAMKILKTENIEHE